MDTPKQGSPSNFRLILQLGLCIGLICISVLLGGCVMNSEQNYSGASYREGYPQQLRLSTERSQMQYVQKPGYYAVHYGHPDAAPSNAIAVLDDGAIAIFSEDTVPASTHRLTTEITITPVYAIEPGGALAVPTGLVFIRFAEATSAETHRDAIQAAGYEIVDIPPYAPQAAWVRSQSGQVANSLAGISRLSAIEDVENVEPQMLMQRVQR